MGHVIETRSTPARYQRQAIFAPIGPEGQQCIQRARVCIVGVGALGTHVADTLARAGVGFLRIVDRDVPELTNLQRQILFDESDLDAGLPKAIAAARRLSAINSEIEIDARAVDVNQTNIEGLIGDVDFVIDGTDNFEIRYLLNDACVKQGIPWIYGGVIGSYGMSMTILPGETPCLRCVFPDPPPPGEAPTCDTAGVLGPAVAAVAAIESAEALKLATGARENLNRTLLSLDIWDLTFDRIPLGEPNTECPCCGRRQFEFLNREAPSHTTQLCGRDAVQVLVHPPARITLASLAERLKPVGEVGYNAYLLRFRTDGYDLTVFPDGRAIIKGTTDPVEARSVYARYIGM
ncbi:MAG: ThiF family adenylyltransferase [Sphaerobacter sp.]|nr:ThiF family adenylyltransferase [Sphaerobacter sp.]